MSEDGRSLFRHPPPAVGDMMKILRESQLKVIEWGSLFSDRDADDALLELAVFLVRLNGAVDRAQRFERTVGRTVVDIRMFIREDPRPDPAQIPLFPPIETARVVIGRRVGGG